MRNIPNIQAKEVVCSHNLARSATKTYTAFVGVDDFGTEFEVGFNSMIGGYDTRALFGSDVVKNHYSVGSEMRNADEKFSHDTFIGVFAINENYVESLIFEELGEGLIGGVAYVESSGEFLGYPVNTVLLIF